jgi:hypothetical protein
MLVLFMLLTVLAVDQTINSSNISPFCAQACTLTDCKGNDQCRCAVIPKTIKCILDASSCSSKEKMQLSSNLKYFLKIKCKGPNLAPTFKEIYGLPKLRKENSTNFTTDGEYLNDIDQKENDACFVQFSAFSFLILILTI